MTFSLYQEGILRLLLEGGRETPNADEFFYNCLTLQFDKVAARYGCELEPSIQRMHQARHYWRLDMASLDTRIEGDGLIIPDHIKHASFLCYWLRRRVVLEYVRDVTEIADSSFQREFCSKFGPEFIFFEVCYKLCLYLELSTPGVSPTDVAEQVDQFALPRSYVREVSVFLHHKNVSTHALYLVFKSLMLRAPRFPTERLRLVSSQ